MRKILIVLAFALAGCSGIVPASIINSPNNPITTQRLYAAESTYAVANQGMLFYRNLRQCRKSEAITASNICRRYSTTLALQAASRNVNNAFLVARKCVQNTASSVDCVSGVEAAVASYSAQVTAATGASP